MLALAGCAAANAGAAPPPAATACAGYSPANPVLRLTTADDGRSFTVHECTSISITLLGSDPGPSEWSFPETSDASVLEVVPLPLPHPQNGVEAVYLAKRSGSAAVSSSPGIKCPPNAMCPSTVRWSVAVTVTA